MPTTIITLMGELPPDSDSVNRALAPDKQLIPPLEFTQAACATGLRAPALTAN